MLKGNPSKYIFSSSSLIDRYKFIIKQRDREIRKIFFLRFADTHMLIFSQQSQIISKNFRSKYTFHIRETIRVIIYRSWKKRKKKKERKKERGTRISIKKKGSLKETTLFHLVPSLSNESRVKMCSIMKVCSHFSDKCIRLRDSRLKKYRIVAIKHFRRTQWPLVQRVYTF